MRMLKKLKKSLLAAAKSESGRGRKDLASADDGLLRMQQEIEQSRRKLLSYISEAKDVTFIRSPGNIGDHLIHAGIRQLLRSIQYKEIPFKRRRLLERSHGHTALISGSGGWCGPFHRVMPQLLEIVERRYERVIVLPSSVDISVPVVRKTLEHTKALFFAREMESYRQLKELGVRAEIAHDCAFYFDFRPYRRPGRGRLLAYRTDAESVSREMPPKNRDISRWCDSLDEWLWTIARHEEIETDRAHVMIAGAMLGKRVLYRASSYHKVPEIARYALRHLPVRPLEG
ncbi:hypothetical protein Rxycam_01914 [Rubrobacter xylanophilus DSM 9941]|nr:hypothetical protein Rxycam_01914 [Rubrobacter xylanophilus DSM 9941]